MICQNYTFEVALAKAVALEVEAAEMQSVLKRAENILFKQNIDYSRREWSQFCDALRLLNSVKAPKP
jgi:hypothetical protein